MLKHRKLAKVTLAVIVVGVFIAGIVPKARYFFLNTVGVRAGFSVNVLDKSTQQPLSGVEVSVAGKTVVTSEGGEVKLNNLELGPTEMSIKRYAFAEVKRDMTIGWGSNPQGEIQLEPRGEQYEFKVKDFLSGNNLEGIKATSGQATAPSDKNGVIILTISRPDEEFSVSISGEGYRTEELKLKADTEEVQTVTMMPARYHTFISERDGKYDLYKIYADGQGKELVLEGTGSEREDMTLLPHPSQNLLAFVSSRSNQTDSTGRPLYVLSLVNLQTNSVEEVATSGRIQLVGWADSHIVYVRVAENSGSDNPKRHRLISYDFETRAARELASDNLFNDVMLVGSKIYYIPSGTYKSSVQANLFKINADGSGRQAVINGDVWNIFRTDYSILEIALAGGDWYEYGLGPKKPVKITGNPEDPYSRVYITSPNGKKAVWVEDGTLSVHDVKSGQNTVLHNQVDMTNPISWLNDSAVVFRVESAAETADYAISISGGSPEKVADVVKTDSLDNWYYH